MFLHSESVKENVVLGTDAKVLSDLVHGVQNAIAVDYSVSCRWRVQPWSKHSRHTHTIMHEHTKYNIQSLYMNVLTIGHFESLSTFTLASRVT